MGPFVDTAKISPSRIGSGCKFDLTDQNEFLWEKYASGGPRYGCRSYIEHAVSLM